MALLNILGAVLVVTVVAGEHGNPDAGFLDPADFEVTVEANPAVTFSVSRTLGDHMVLQRAPASAVVWGFAPAGTVVTTTFKGVKYTSVPDSKNVWRTHLSPTEAGGPYTISIDASTGETATLSDVLFGDVYICGGQSNMQFTVRGNENQDKYIKEADNYPTIRLFTVGQKTSSPGVPLMDLRTIEQNWTAASSESVGGPGFGYFSAVCWFFGKGIHDALDGQVPIGLISNNWGGTQVELWMSPATSLPCGHASSGALYNSMIHPYTVGPMAVLGFTWYQGESDLGGKAGLPDQNKNYSCTQTVQIQQWRKEFNVPQAFYGVVQLSTWLASPELLAELRDQQLVSGDLIPNFVYATNADHGAGANIHPPYKQYPGARLANAALSIVYNKGINWRSPTYASAMATGTGTLTVWLNDVLEEGLVLKPPANARTAGDCAHLNAKTPGTCAWAELQFNDPAQTWVNASVAIGADKKTMVLTAAPPAQATKVIASSYGWGSIPMMTVYRGDMDGKDGQLPVLTWKRALPDSQLHQDQQAVMV